MRARDAVLFPTERQVDAALAEGRHALTLGAFLARATAGLEVRPAPSEVSRLATALALGEVHAGPAGSASEPLADAVDEALGAVRRAGVDASVLARSSSPRGRLHAELLERTDQMFRERRLFDERAIGWVAAGAIERAAPNELPASVVIDGVFSFDPSQLAWIEALALRSEVRVRLPRAAPDAVLSMLEGRWQSLPRSPDLELYELGLPERITPIEARTDGAETRAIAGVVARAIALGTPAESIGIVVPDLDESFLEPLRAALVEAGLPFREPRGRSPEAAPAVHAALSWLRLATATLQRDVLIDLLRTRAVDPAPFIDGASASIRRTRALALAARLARTPVRTDRDGKLLSEVLAAELPSESDDAWMIDSLAKVVEARADLAREAPRAEMAAKLGQVWRAMGLEEPSKRTLAELVASDPRSREADLLAAQLRDHAAGFRALADAVDRVVGAAAVLGVGRVAVSPGRFRSELERSLVDAPSAGTRRPGGVRILRASEAARVPTQLLVVARASEGTFESASGRASADDRLFEASPPSRRPPSVFDLAGANRMAVLCAADATRHLVLTRSESDAEGRARAPAPWFAELANGRSVQREPASRLHPGASTLSERGAALARLAEGGVPEDGDVARRVDVERERLAFFLDPKRPGGPHSGAVAPDDVIRAHLVASFGGTSARPIAATGIERAAQCHFAAFAGSVLGASSVDTIGEGLEPWQRGSLIHRALLIAFETLRKCPPGAPDEMAAAAALAVRKAVLKDKVSPLYRAEAERALRDVAAVVDWSMANDSEFRFAYGEQSFGESRQPARRGEAVWPPLAIGSPSVIYVKGRIDRIDLSRDGSRARVIDYKTGTLPAWKDVGVSLFQPPLYAYALLQQLGQLSAPEIRSLYLDTSKRPPHPLPAENRQILSIDAMKAAEQRAARVVLQLWDGDVAPRPADAAICGRCDARDICRRPAAMPIDDLELDGEGPAT